MKISDSGLKTDILEKAICFQAQVIKLQTMADGGWRLTLDIVEPSAIEARDALDKARKTPGVILEVAAVAVKFEGKKDTW